MYKALHPRDYADRLYVSRKGRRGLTSIEDGVYASILKKTAEQKGDGNTAYNWYT